MREIICYLTTKMYKLVCSRYNLIIIIHALLEFVTIDFVSDVPLGIFLDIIYSMGLIIGLEHYRNNSLMCDNS